MSVRRYLALLGIALLVALIANGGGSMAAAQQPQADDDERVRTVSVTGTGEVHVVPDRAVVRLGVQTEAEAASDALTQNNRLMQALIAALQEDGIALEDIQTRVVQLQPQREQPVEPRQGVGEVIGYLATNIVEVTVRDLQNLGATIDAAVQAGGNTVQGISFQVSDPGQAVREARLAAMRDATMAAEQLAMLAGAALGEVLTISEARSAPVVVERAVAAEVAAVPIQPGAESVQVTVNVTWSLQ